MSSMPGLVASTMAAQMAWLSPDSVERSGADRAARFDPWLSDQAGDPRPVGFTCPRPQHQSRRTPRLVVCGGLATIPLG